MDRRLEKEKFCCRKETRGADRRIGKGIELYKPSCKGELMDNIHLILLIAVSALVTMMIRFAPFLLIGGEKKTPEMIQYLGEVLPYAVMGMLVVYCLKHISFVIAPYGLPELIACAVVAGLHILKRNTLLSIICGTICYMILVQNFF